MQNKKLEDTNPKLDASQEFAQKVGADYMMNARVKTGELSLEEKRKEVEKFKKDMREYNKKSEARAEENKRRRTSNISKVKSFVGKYGENLDDIKGVQTFVKIAEGGKKLIVINQDSIFRDFSDKFNVRVFEAEEGKVITKQTGNFGRVDSSIFDNPFTNRKSSGQATIMYDGVGGEVENKTFAIKELPPIEMPKAPKFMEKSAMQGWFHVMSGNAVTEDDEKFIKKFEPLAKNTIPIPFSSSTDDGIHLLPSPIPSGGLNLAAKLAVNYAKGDLTPITKSPGSGFDRVVINAIRATMEGGETEDNASKQKDGIGTNSYFNTKSKGGAIRYDVLISKASDIKKIGYAPVTAALGQFNIKATDKGIQIIDDFDIDGDSTNVGAAAILDPLTKFIGGTDVQQTANRLVGIAANRAAELGFDMTNQKGIPMASFDSFGNEIEPAIDSKGNMVRAKVETPRDYKIPINYTIPWHLIPPSVKSGMGYGNLLTGRQKQTIQKSNQAVSKETPKAVEKIKSMTKARNQSMSLDEPIVRRKKKRG